MAYAYLIQVKPIEVFDALQRCYAVGVYSTNCRLSICRLSSSSFVTDVLWLSVES